MDGGACTDSRTCPRVFVSDRGTAVLQGYVVNPDQRPELAAPPEGETQVELPVEQFLAFAKTVEAAGADEDLFAGWQHTLFRLETLPQYLVEAEAEAFRGFREGRAIPMSTPTTNDWYRYLQTAAESGKQLQRVHVLSQPLTDYLRFELSVYPASERLGYETLIADRADHPELVALTSDFYLFDADEPGAYAVLMSYDSEGHWLGMWRTDDPPVLDICRRHRAIALAAAVPLAEFVASLGEPLGTRA